MTERDGAQLERMSHELQYIRDVTADVSEAAFLRDETLQHALTMSLLIIGECANRLSDEFKNHYTHIEWHKIIAVRNIAAHGYWQLDMRQIWHFDFKQTVIFEKRKRFRAASSAKFQKITAHA